MVHLNGVKQLDSSLWLSYHLFQLTISRYSFASLYAKNRVVLDIASGNGFGVSYLKDGGARIVVGGDISRKVVQCATSNYGKDGICFLQLDARQLPFNDKTFDLVTSIETIEHLREHEHFLRECKRVLKKDGYFVCSTPNKQVVSADSELPWFPDHVKELDIHNFRNLLDKYFYNVVIYGIVADMKPPSVMYKLIHAYGKPLKLILLTIPKFVVFMNFFSIGDALSRYRLVNLAEINKTNFDKILEKKYKPFRLQDDSPTPGYIIGVANA